MKMFKLVDNQIIAYGIFGYLNYEEKLTYTHRSDKIWHIFLMLLVEFSFYVYLYFSNNHFYFT